MSYAVGSLVEVRGREWVVLPESTPQLLRLRPLGGTDDEVAGVLTALEQVRPARFEPPDASSLGDSRSGKLLRDAVRLGFRSSAGPFRSFARIAVDPRPYQLVPLLMALRLDPVRLLIADDVGIGKTVESGLVARELIDRGDARRLAVLCPPHLAEQWQAELSAKFNLEAELVLPSSASRLEKRCAAHQSLFDVYPHVIVSTDFIKTESRQADFLKSCPELVIVDEAHTCALGSGRGRHQRFELLKGLAASPERHVILVTATPHSGKDESFRSLLSLLRPEFANLPDDLSGPKNEALRRQLATHLVQRRRVDIRHFLKSDTPFPERLETDAAYKLSGPYKKLFDRVLAFARESVAEEGQPVRQRIRWWSALALLRSLASSPAAAAATLRNRAAVADAEGKDEVDRIGRSTVLDLDAEDSTEAVEAAPGSVDESLGPDSSTRKRLRELAGEAEKLCGKGDEKLNATVKLLKELMEGERGSSPIVFCRFIDTADYVAAQLQDKLPKGTVVASVTGVLPPAEREARIEDLARAEKRVLVCTDCLSEGINLQDKFDAVVHYDLAWNPTRHEQREGRVDRYGQTKKEVKVVTLFGKDNQIDGIVLDVLLRKHQSIRKALGVSVPVPVDTNGVVEAVFEGLLLRGKTGGAEQIPLFEDLVRPQREELHRVWEAASEKEKRSRTVYAQESIKPDEVMRELESVRRLLGTGGEVRTFVAEALAAHGAQLQEKEGTTLLDLREAPRGLRETLGERDQVEVRFEPPAPPGVEVLHRTHPLVSGLAGYVMDTALDPRLQGVARRAGVMRTRAVSSRTTALLLRYRFHLIRKKGQTEQALLAEDCGLVAYRGQPESAEWLDEQAAEALLSARPEANVGPESAAAFLAKASSPEARSLLAPRLDEAARRRGDELLTAHLRVKDAARVKGVSWRVEPVLPPDVLGLYVFLPA